MSSTLTVPEVLIGEFFSTFVTEPRNYTDLRGCVGFFLPQILLQFKYRLNLKSRLIPTDDLKKRQHSSMLCRIVFDASV